MNQLPKEMLPELKIESFVTSLADEKLINLEGVEIDSEVMGGCWTPLSWQICPTPTNTACSTTDLYPNTGCGC